MKNDIHKKLILYVDPRVLKKATIIARIVNRFKGGKKK